MSTRASFRRAWAEERARRLAAEEEVARLEAVVESLEHHLSTVRQVRDEYRRMLQGVRRINTDLTSGAIRWVDKS